MNSLKTIMYMFESKFGWQGTYKSKIFEQTEKNNDDKEIKCQKYVKYNKI